MTIDGSTIYMPHGLDSGDGYATILDASNGRPTGSIYTGTNLHNTIVSLDNTRAYLTGHSGGTAPYMHIVDTATNQVVLNAGPAISGIGPFTVNGNHTLAFAVADQTCGFQVIDLNGGNVLYTITFSGSCVWTATDQPSHGISLSPDEKRVYVMNAAQDKLEVYDVSTVPASAPTLHSSTWGCRAWTATKSRGACASCRKASA